MATQKKSTVKKGVQKKSVHKKASQKEVKPKRVERKTASQMKKMRAEVAPIEVVPIAEILPATEKTLAFSYLTLRKTVGLLGTTLPFVVSLGALFIFGQGFQTSISSYYYTGMRDVFVGMLCAIGLFLYSYKGYIRADEIAGKLSFVFALGVAFFPTTPDGPVSSTAQIIGVFHLIFAALFFLTLSYFCLFLFVKTNPTGFPPMTERKMQRNRVYRTCGGVMVGCILVMGIYHLAGGDETSLANLNPIYWLEAIAIVAFGISWLTKGEAILADEE